MASLFNFTFDFHIGTWSSMCASTVRDDSRHCLTSARREGRCSRPAAAGGAPGPATPPASAPWEWNAPPKAALMPAAGWASRSGADAGNARGPGPPAPGGEGCINDLLGYPFWARRVDEQPRLSYNNCTRFVSSWSALTAAQPWNPHLNTVT